MSDNTAQANLVPASRNSLTGLARGELDTTALTLPDDLTYDEWVDYGHRLACMVHAVKWWIGDWWSYGKHRYGERAKAAAESSWKFQTCMNAGWVARKIETSRRREVLPWEHHAAVAGFNPADQDYFLDRWEEQAVKDGAPLPLHLVRWEIAQFKRRGNQFGEPPALEECGPFDVLYADPPWRFGPPTPSNRAIENHYPTTELDEICALQPPIFEDAVLFLWAVPTLREDAHEVINAWGFKYRDDIVWAKDKMGMGVEVRHQHEYLLIAKRGDMPPPHPSVRKGSIVTAPRTQHSRKPDEFYNLIETMYPGRRYGELFARRPRQGWASWGNQLVVTP
jgi:N6-adenosine-specific RNA methylase IME4